MRTHSNWQTVLVVLLGVAVIWSSPPLAGGGAEPPPRIKATLVVPLRNMVGREVVVYGHIDRTGTSRRSGHHFLNFANSELTAVCYGPDVSKFTAGRPADVYKGKDVEIRGTVSLYRGQLQIKLSDPSQIKVLDSQRATPGSSSPPATVELKKIGTDVWLSPAGLKYAGRDPEGRTRVEHVLRHARDIPQRDGPHGVFDGGPGVVFAVIDEAWLLAAKRQIRPRTEDERSLYLVPVGRRIGYLGGKTGAARGHPPLSNVFIVIETRTKNVITAFPR